MKRKLIFPSEKDDDDDDLPFGDDCATYSIENSKLLFTGYKGFEDSEKLNRISSFPLNSYSALSVQKTSGCDLLPGSFLEANTLFGMDISRTSHIEEIEKFQNTGNDIIKESLKVFKSLFAKPNKYLIIDGKIVLNGKTIFAKFKEEEDMNCNDFDCCIEYDKDDEPILVIEFKKKPEKSTVYIEADISLEIKDSEGMPANLRLVSPSIYFSAPVTSRNIEIIADCCCIEKNSDCNAMILRSNNLEIIGQVLANDFIFIGDELKTEGLLCVYNILCVSSVGNVKIDQISGKNLFIHCENLVFKEKLILTDLFVKTHKLDIQKGCYIEGYHCFFESHKITNYGEILSRNKLSMLFLFEKKDEEVFSNKSKVTTLDFFVEANCCVAMKPGMVGKMRNYSGITVKNSFLLSNGNFVTKNTTIRSLYISEYNKFKSNGELSIGDFFVVEKNSKFSHVGVFLPYSLLKPIVLISGKFKCSLPLKVGKFISNGTLKGSLNIDSVDLVSLSCSGELDVLDIHAPLFVLSEKANLLVNKAKIIAPRVEIASRSIRPFGEDTEIEIGSIDTNIRDDLSQWTKKNIHEIEVVEDKKAARRRKKFETISTPPAKKKEIDIASDVKPLD